MSNCPCAGKHVPAPMQLVALDRTDGTVLELCPTAESNLKHLLSEYNKAGGTPIGAVTKHYGKLIRLLAADVYFNKTQGNPNDGRL